MVGKVDKFHLPFFAASKNTKQKQSYEIIAFTCWFEVMPLHTGIFGVGAETPSYRGTSCPNLLFRCSQRRDEHDSDDNDRDSVTATTTTTTTTRNPNLSERERRIARQMRMMGEEGGGIRD